MMESKITRNITKKSHAILPVQFGFRIPRNISKRFKERRAMPEISTFLGQAHRSKGGRSSSSSSTLSSCLSKAFRPRCSSIFVASGPNWLLPPRDLRAPNLFSTRLLARNPRKSKENHWKRIHTGARHRSLPPFRARRLRRSGAAS